MRSNILHRQLKGKPFRTKRVTFTVEQIDNFNRLWGGKEHDTHSARNESKTGNTGLLEGGFEHDEGCRDNR